jgi:hypothetical protein
MDNASSGEPPQGNGAVIKWISLMVLVALATESYLEAEQDWQMQGIQVSEWNKKTES